MIGPPRSIPHHGFIRAAPRRRNIFPLLVTHTWIHLWQNPSHSDLHTYNSRPLSKISRFFSRVSLARNAAKVTRDARPRTTWENVSGITPNNEAPGDVELATRSSKIPDTNHNFATHESQDARSSYVFLRTPKKLGAQLIVDDEDPPEA